MKFPYQLYWLDSEGQGSICCDQYESLDSLKEDMWAAVEELLGECGTLDEQQSIMAGRMIWYYRGAQVGTCSVESILEP